MGQAKQPDPDLLKKLGMKYPRYTEWDDGTIYFVTSPWVEEYLCSKVQKETKKEK